MKHIFIINPAAGKKDSRQRVYTMAEALKKNHNLDVECMLTKSRGHATALTRAIAETGDYVRFYACGGDGTVNEIANGIAGFPNAAMTCIPIGTGNDFLKNFGKDAEPLFLDAENLWNGDVTPLDLIDCNGKYCLTIACTGIDARIAESVHEFGASPMLSGRGSYLASVAVNFLFRKIGARHGLGDSDGRIEGFGSRYRLISYREKGSKNILDGSFSVASHDGYAHNAALFEFFLRSADEFCVSRIFVRKQSARRRFGGFGAQRPVPHHQRAQLHSEVHKL